MPWNRMIKRAMWYWIMWVVIVVLFFYTDHRWLWAHLISDFAMGAYVGVLIGRMTWYEGRYEESKKINIRSI